MHDYLARVGESGSQSKVGLRLVEHLYFKHQGVYDAMRRLALQQQQQQAAEAQAAAAAAAGQEAEAERQAAEGGGDEDNPQERAAGRDAAITAAGEVIVLMVRCGGAGRGSKLAFPPRRQVPCSSLVA